LGGAYPKDKPWRPQTHLAKKGRSKGEKAPGKEIIAGKLLSATEELERVLLRGAFSFPPARVEELNKEETGKRKKVEPRKNFRTGELHWRAHNVSIRGRV